MLCKIYSICTYNRVVGSFLTIIFYKGSNRYANCNAQIGHMYNLYKV